MLLYIKYFNELKGIPDALTSESCESRLGARLTRLPNLTDSKSDYSVAATLMPARASDFTCEGELSSKGNGFSCLTAVSGVAFDPVVAMVASDGLSPSISSEHV